MKDIHIKWIYTVFIFTAQENFSFISWQSGSLAQVHLAKSQYRKTRHATSVSYPNTSSNCHSTIDQGLQAPEMTQPKYTDRNTKSHPTTAPWSQACPTNQSEHIETRQYIPPCYSMFKPGMPHHSHSTMKPGMSHDPITKSGHTASKPLMCKSFWWDTVTKPDQCCHDMAKIFPVWS